MPLPGKSAQIDLPELTADCSRCAALCCVAYPFQADEDFAILKETDHPCPNLSQSCFSCTIHANLNTRGFGGCIAYSCARRRAAGDRGAVSGRDMARRP
ncbi:hypothetical protein L0Z66_05590 [Phaeobacter sp. BS34]